MTDPLFLTILVAAVASIAYGVLLILVMRNRAYRGRDQVMLLVALATTALSVLPHAVLHPLSHHPLSELAHLYPGNMTQPALGVYLTALSIASFGLFSLRFLRRGLYVLWGAFCVVWLVLVLGAGFSAASMTLGDPGWVRDSLETGYLPGVIVIAGGVIAFLFQMGVTVIAYRAAILSEAANRALFWAFVVPLFFLGAWLGTSGVQPWAEVGWSVQLVGMGGAVHAMTAHRVYDMRRGARRAFGATLMILLTALVILTALVLVQAASTPPTFVDLAVLAVVVAVLYVPLRGLAEWLSEQIVGRAFYDPTQALRRYSEDVVGQIDLYQLVERLMATLDTVLKVRSGCLILVTGQNGAVSLEPLWPGESASSARGLLKADSPIRHALHADRAALRQYDLEFQSQYARADEAERAFFAGLRMSAYAPIMMDGELIGIVAAGPKANDDPFYPQDLELLATVANQTGVALRNARLVADLRALNAEMFALNESLNTANTSLARLDKVKTDFVTIASHELRTPLAQIRGYTDILAMETEDGAISEDQILGMVEKLRGASDRLEDLISDMLDVSQLDVNAMDLHFTETSAETVLRMAIEPLTDAIRERKLTLAARGLRDLPPLQADLKRLVQAFRNIVLNAIKYTPDGGRIDIMAGVAETDDDGAPTAIQISVTDTGVGIAPENRELIFEKFFRGTDPALHSTGATKFMGAGPGLGLTIARGVIEGHGGRIWCESPGFDQVNFPGSTFYVMLPVQPPDEAGQMTPLEATGASTPAPVL
ncbi:MAG: GAF domain-containing sensor histidine kinase [Anaerolineae bacterium]|nr:GAF domain-containing sensor histidine kinase [Anaerolineae bacterium]